MTVTETLPGRARGSLWIDAAILACVAGLGFGALQVAAEWEQPLRPAVGIDLSPAALPRYALYSLARGWIAYALSLAFTLLVASWAYYDRGARRFILPALDVLQSVPVLGFLPGLVLALVGLFPGSNAGLELAGVLMIFTGQVWNMTFSYYDSLRAVPEDFRVLGRLYGFRWYHRFLRIELPSGAQGLLYNSMVSMAGGWFFLSITEAFRLGDQDFRLPGIGSYMSVAIERGDVRAQVFGLVAMGAVIVAVDRLVWGPLVLWSRRFKLDDFGGAAEESRLQRWLARSRAAQAAAVWFGQQYRRFIPSPGLPALRADRTDAAAGSGGGVGRGLYRFVLVALAAVILWGSIHLTHLLGQVDLGSWLEILRSAGWSFLRVFAAVALGTLWTVPAGVWIGFNPRLANRVQPLVQFAASFPAPMIYPWILAVVLGMGGNLEWGAVPLILLGTQWYILFNVAAAAAAVPADILSAAALLRLRGWARWRKFILPAVLPGLVTGWITAAGGAWNATIVAEFVHAGGRLHEATGLGALISRATDDGNFPKLAAAVLVMALVVAAINRFLWKRLQAYANDRCRFGT